MRQTMIDQSFQIRGRNQKVLDKNKVDAEGKMMRESGSVKTEY